MLTGFNHATDSITHYLQRVNLYFAANNIEDDLKAATLLSSIGASTYAPLCDLVAPDEPGKQTLDQISSLLKKHYEPTRVQKAERFNFRKRNQAAGESIADYDASLRNLATYCDFGTNLEVELRDQIVCGLRYET